MGRGKGAQKGEKRRESREQEEKERKIACPHPLADSLGVFLPHPDRFSPLAVVIVLVFFINHPEG